MELLKALMILIAGGWLLFSSLVINTKNFKSAMFFKVVPFFMGVGLLIFVSMFL